VTTESASIEGSQESAQGAASRERSTIGFPYDDLNDAIQVARSVHEFGGSCTSDQIAPRLGYSSVDNGAFRTRVATARHFGLVTTNKDNLTITSLGREVVDPTTEARARVNAFLKVPLYERVYTEHKGFTLPPAAGLEMKFVEYGVAAKQKDKARFAFQRSAEQAGFFQQGKDRLVAPALPIERAATVAPTPPRDTGNENGAGGGGMHPFIRGLVDTLPPPGTPWSDVERDEWLTAAKSIFALIYKPNRVALPAAGGTGQQAPAEQSIV
jgi:hypothetical protein